jgi:CubicO group peptidase (beta-lactamase class C family)
MVGLWVITAASVMLSLPAAAQGKKAAAAYVPGATWERRAPAAAGMDGARLDSAIAFHYAHEAKAPRDQAESWAASAFGREPYGEPIGPFGVRGEPTGLVVRGGYVVAAWGDPSHVEITHSVTKSFLSTVVGLAVDRGLIRSVNDTVRGYVGLIEPLRTGDQQRGLHLNQPPLLELFETPHNRTITWDHLLRQTSDWEGTLWGKPEWADRPSGDPQTYRTRPRVPAGSVFEYNDVRVNVLALAATNVWRRPLPQVLKEFVMDPIGASLTWRWYGYDNSWIVLDGAAVQSVSGGGHFGGGMFINAWDMARFGLLTERRGVWGDKRLLSDAWVAYATTPTPANTGYGVMNWFLNTDRKMLPSAPASAWVHLGNGNNMIYVDPEHDLVVVARWIDNGSMDGFVSRVLAALR